MSWTGGLGEEEQLAGASGLCQVHDPVFYAKNSNREGNKIVMQPRGLNIVWGNDARYWKIPTEGPAELIQVSWLEVSGVLRIEDNKKYKISFEVRVKEDGFGWNGTDVLVMAKIGKTGKYEFRVHRLSPGQLTTIPTQPLVIQGVSGMDLHFGLYEVWSGKWKGGLEIYKAKVEAVP
ncbi:unnamed protein product [Sphenostylis stenocarpa]|uniref:Uncharacterized protein n=1 Tax=Sphenostylis stenocarpa TaxID=92480 RepID=A0AA86SZ26_9FABA|nr:unnamed protein product [Sphenostylis stenocarpa]